MASASGLIEISDVAAEPSGGRLAGAELNMPASGDSLPTYAIDLRGWVVGNEARVTGVELRPEGTGIGAAPLDVGRPHMAGRHGVEPGIGFRALLNGLLLPPEFDLEVAAVTESGDRAPIAVVRGRRAELPAPGDLALQPLIVTTLGRTG